MNEYAKCVQCGNFFAPKTNTTGIYCRSECWYAWQRAKRRGCAICGTPIAGKKARRFCSVRCKGLASQHPRNAESPPAIVGAAWIQLDHARFALVDDADAAAMNAYRWYVDTKGYASRVIDKRGRRALMHRELMGAQVGEAIDHANGDRLDNRRSNLRRATMSDNARNSVKKCRPGVTSQYKGVHWARSNGKWCAMIRTDGRTRYLGLFTEERAAALAYDAAAREAFGEFARINFPAGNEAGALRAS
jgi:hypothetical protein